MCNWCLWPQQYFRTNFDFWTVLIECNEHLNLKIPDGRGIGPFARNDAAVHRPGQRIGKFQTAIFCINSIYANDLGAIGVHKYLHEGAPKFQVIAKGFCHVMFRVNFSPLFSTPTLLMIASENAWNNGSVLWSGHSVSKSDLISLVIFRSFKFNFIKITFISSYINTIIFNQWCWVKVVSPFY